MTDKYGVLDKLKNPAVAMLAGGLLVLIALGIIKPGDMFGGHKVTPAEVEAFTADEMRGILRKEILPLRAGIEELAKATSLETQVRVLQAMSRAERRQESNPN